MNAEQQRIAIAEWIGWKNNGAGAFHKNGRVATLVSESSDGCGGIGFNTEELPNYPEDLNAMNEAEEKLNTQEHYRFRTILWEMTDDVNNDVWNRQFCSATASKRAEALCRTLWSERFEK